MSGRNIHYSKRKDGRDIIAKKEIGDKSSVSWASGYGKETGMRTGIEFESSNDRGCSIKGDARIGHRSGFTSDLANDQEIDYNTSLKAATKYRDRSGFKCLR